MSTKTQTIRQWNKLIPFAGLLLVLGLIFSFSVVKSHPAPSLGGAAPAISAGILRGRAADAARDEAMAQYFASKDAANLTHSRSADAVRYEAMAQYFAAKDLANLERSRAADAARWEAMAKYFAAKEAATLGN